MAIITFTALPLVPVHITYSNDACKGFWVKEAGPRAFVDVWWIVNVKCVEGCEARAHVDISWFD